MKKHVFGLAIFSFIVFTVAFIYGIFTRSMIESDGIKIISTHPKFERELNQSKDTSPKVVQAVYSVKTKTLTWGSANFSSVGSLAQNALGSDLKNYRGDFLDLVRKGSRLKNG